MRTDIPGVEWLLALPPREAQLEALARSYTGVSYRDGVAAVPTPSGARRDPLRGWGHMLEMRLGKTPTLLNEFMLLKRDWGVRRLLVFAPNRYKDEWVLECRKFGIDVEAFGFDSRRRKHAGEWAARTREAVLVVNYEALIQRETADFLEGWVSREPTMLGCDESVLLKNRESIWTTRALQLAHDCQYVRLLSGKPVVQGVHDLYSQFRMIGQCEGIAYHAFRNRFCLMGGYRGKQVLGVKNEHHLQSVKDRSMFFAKRRDWMETYETDFVTRSIGMTPEQQKRYNEMDREFVVWLEGGDSVSAEQIVTKRIKLQQISSGWVYDEERNPRDFMPFAKTPKFLELAAMLEEEQTGKTIVVALYSHTVDKLLEALAKYQPATIRGEADMKAAGQDITEEKRRFNEDPACRVLVAQIRAVKYGHTLMGNPADPCETTVFFENSYSLDDRAQAEQRNQGAGQTQSAVVIDYACSNIERDIIDALQKKNDLAERITSAYRRTKP